MIRGYESPVMPLNYTTELVSLLGFEPRLCPNLGPMPEYKAGVLPLHYRDKLVLSTGNDPVFSDYQSEVLPLN